MSLSIYMEYCFSFTFSYKLACVIGSAARLFEITGKKEKIFAPLEITQHALPDFASNIIIQGRNCLLMERISIEIYTRRRA